MRPRPAVSCRFAAARIDAIFLPAVQGGERRSVAHSMASARTEDPGRPRRKVDADD